MVELADAPDSKSGDGDIVRVQVPPSAPSPCKQLGLFSVPMRDLEPAQTTPSFPCAARSRTAPRCPLSALPVRQVPPSAPTTEGSPLRQKYEAVLLPHIFCFLARFLPCAKAGLSEIVTLTRLDIFCQAVPFRRSLFRRFAPYKSRLRHQKPELTCSGFFVPYVNLSSLF